MHIIVYLCSIINEVELFNHNLFVLCFQLCSAWRFAPLLLAYALFRINNPWVIGVSTWYLCIIWSNMIPVGHWCKYTIPVGHWCKYMIPVGHWCKYMIPILTWYNWINKTHGLFSTTPLTSVLLLIVMILKDTYLNVFIVGDNMWHLYILAL